MPKKKRIHGKRVKEAKPAATINAEQPQDEENLLSKLPKRKTASRISIVSKYAYARWHRLVNAELTKNGMDVNEDGHFYTYSCGRALKAMGIPREDFLLSLKQYKKKHGEAKLIDVYETHGLHIDSSDKVKAKIIAAICSKTRIGTETLRQVRFTTK